MTIGLKERLDTDSEQKTVFDLDKELEELNVRQRTIFDMKLRRSYKDPEWCSDHGLNPKDPDIKIQAGEIVYKDLFKAYPHFTRPLRKDRELY